MATRTISMLAMSITTEPRVGRITRAVMLRPSANSQLVTVKCPYDNARVTELINVDYEILDESIDPFSFKLPGFGSRCTGHCFGNGNARTWYYFLFSSQVAA